MNDKEKGLSEAMSYHNTHGHDKELDEKMSRVVKIQDKYELRFTSHNSEGKLDSIGFYNNSDEEGVIINLLPREEIIVVTQEELDKLEEDKNEL